MSDKRSFNARGQNIIERSTMALTSLFLFVGLIYASVRGHKIVTQLPATYRTTAKPNQIPIDFINQIFPSKLPDPTYEFPAVTLCPQVGALAGIITCFVTKSPTGIKIPCDDMGTYPRFVTFDGSKLECMVVNDRPGKPLVATDSNDVFTITASLSGTKQGSPAGVFATAHPQVGMEGTPITTFDNFFAAGVNTSNEVMARKVYQIDQKNVVKQSFETKISSVQLVPLSGNNSIMPYMVIEFRYPKLEVTYEKSFLILDMNNWLGEVGGLGFLLYLLHRLVIEALGFVLKRSEKFSYSIVGKDINDGFVPI